MSPLALDQWRPGMTHREGLLHINSHNPLNMYVREVKTLYLQYHIAYDHKTIMLVTYLKELSPINSHDIAIKWSCEVT